VSGLLVVMHTTFRCRCHSAEPINCLGWWWSIVVNLLILTAKVPQLKDCRYTFEAMGLFVAFLSRPSNGILLYKYVSLHTPSLLRYPLTNVN